MIKRLDCSFISQILRSRLTDQDKLLVLDIFMRYVRGVSEIEGNIIGERGVKK